MRFIVISKSGGTPETLVQALAALEAVKDAGLEKRIPELFLGVTEPAGRRQGATACARCSSSTAFRCLDHHPGIGGRFSVLTNVGLLAAIARGLDARAVRAGARAVVDATAGRRRSSAILRRRGRRRGRGARARAGHPRCR